MKSFSPLEFNDFIAECESLANDMEENDPFVAPGDGERIRKLIEIAREWYEIKKVMPCK